MDEKTNNSVHDKKSAEFLFKYSWKGKSREQIIEEMELADYEQKYLGAAMKELEKEGMYTGFDLGRRILLLIDINEDGDEFDPDDAVYIR
ncbi:hypothetical protein FOA24_19170 [Bacillus thuringiensis]|uniref:hypothetical protein n=1 Tax=Bacillus thuringiensis TaxID=1428 RepID=UPI003338F7F2